MLHNTKMDLCANSTSQPLPSWYKDANNGIINYTEYHESERRDNVCKVEIKEEPEEVNDIQEEGSNDGIKMEEIEFKEEECGLEREFVRCFHCGEKRLSNEDLREHIYSNHSLLFVEEQNAGDIGAKTSEKPFQCHLCSYRTSRRIYLKEHVRKHTGEKPFKCDKCEYRSARKRGLKSHTRTHTGEKPYKCEICGYETAHLSNMKVHSLQHTWKKRHQCQFCEYSTVSSSELRIHSSKHSGESPYKCEICRFRTLLRSELKSHCRKHTGDKRYKCDVCEFRTPYRSYLKIHAFKHTGEKPYKCEMCGYRTAHQSSLRTHSFRHISEKGEVSGCRPAVSDTNNSPSHQYMDNNRLKCHICDYSAALKSKLILHIRTHTVEKHFKCNKCEYRTVSVDALKPFRCNLCEYDTATYEHLKAHIANHTGEKAFKCNLCRFATTTNSYLMRHIRRHALKGAV